MAKTVIKDDFFETLEGAVRSIISNTDSSIAEKMQAIKAGTDLLKIKHKVGDGDGGNKPGSFFK